MQEERLKVPEPLKGILVTIGLFWLSLVLFPCGYLWFSHASWQWEAMDVVWGWGGWYLSHVARLPLQVGLAMLTLSDASVEDKRKKEGKEWEPEIPPLQPRWQLHLLQVWQCVSETAVVWWLVQTYDKHTEVLNGAMMAVMAWSLAEVTTAYLQLLTQCMLRDSRTERSMTAKEQLARSLGVPQLNTSVLESTVRMVAFILLRWAYAFLSVQAVSYGAVIRLVLSRSALAVVGRMGYWFLSPLVTDAFLSAVAAQLVVVSL